MDLTRHVPRNSRVSFSLVPSRVPRLAAALLVPAALAGLVGTAVAAPTLEEGVWTEITPSQVTAGNLDTCLGQGIQFDTQNPSTIYWGSTPYQAANGGLFKSTDSGETWNRVASITPAWDGASDYLDMPLHVRIDPWDSNHLYAGDGVRGSSNGFFVSTDGGETFVTPPGFGEALTEAGIDNRDIYDVATDPVNFDHLLISFHYRWGWTETKWNANSGVMESTDGGESWIVHEPVDGWGSGHAIKFLYNPELGLGDSNTWLIGTQGNGYWRTTNAGGDWEQVSTVNISHGGGTIYWTADGTLYASGETTIRSTDNGATWSTAWGGSSWAVHGDGETLYSGRTFGGNELVVSPETDGLNWTGIAGIADGPYEMAYDTTNGIIYSSNWSSGVFALKVGEGTGVIPEPPVAGGSSGNPPASGGTGGSAATTGGSSSTTGGSILGSGGSGGSVSSGGSVVTTGGSTGAPMNGATGSSRPGAADAGCACRVTPGSTSSNGLWVAMGALALGLIRARRRR
jgi:MYXO-CTERM domain-containing protein